ncbi:hypothetical protein V8E55_003485 [Tylopilus felleus]
MSQRKQTARKTTGKHVSLSHAIRSKSRSQTRHRGSALEEFLKDAGAVPVRLSTIGSLGSSAPAPPSPTTSPSSSSRFDCPSPPLPASGFDPAPGPLVAWRRPVVHVLDNPISVCLRFATWLESQTCVHGDTLLCAIERDGRSFLALAKATVAFDHALRGRLPPTANGVASAFGEHARTLRVFADLLTSKMSEGSLSRELETAVLRDGEALLRLALCCLELDQAIKGSGGTAGNR